MKIVVTTRGTNVSAPVDPRFGRAPQFMLFDTESGIARLIDNTESANAAHGAGTEAARLVSSLGADVLLTGSCGPKALQALKAAGVQVVEGAQGSVAEAIEDYTTRLQKLSSAGNRGTGRAT